MNRGSGVLSPALIGALGCVSVLAPLAAERPTHAVLIKAPKPHDALVAAIENAEGRVTQHYQFVDGLAAEVPDDALVTIERLVGAGNIGRDEVLRLPVTNDPRSGDQLFAQAETDDAVEDPVEQETVEVDTGVVETVAAADSIEPQGSDLVEAQSSDRLELETSSVDVERIAASNTVVPSVVIAVIDTGYRRLFGLDPSPNELQRLIDPGFSFVPGEADELAIQNANAPHGTQVAAIAAANKFFCLSTTNVNTSRVVAVAQAYGLATLSNPPCSVSTRLIRVTGTAPGARILPMKVVRTPEEGAPASRVIKAIDKAIALRQEFDKSQPGEEKGLNIKVVNISLGAPTNAAARTLLDEAIDKLLVADIVPVLSAGDDGFSSVTISSPATSMSALTVGAASIAVHERIFRAQFSFPCSVAPLATVRACTETYRPDGLTQVADFSSRGPTHDGRIGPHVVANGVGVFSQGSGGATGTNINALDLVNGTSFAAPAVSGIAAALRQQFPNAKASQIRNAIIMSANPATIPTATPNDQGAGFVNADAAAALLQAGTVPDTVATTALFTRSVPGNMARAGRIVYKDVASVAFSNIRPAEIADVPFLVPPKTGTLRVRLHSIVPSLPSGQQNQFFGDDLFLRIQSAAVHRRDRRLDNAFLAAGTDNSYSFDNPEPGVWRITPSGDWTNAGAISFTVEVWTTGSASPQHTVKADIVEGAQHVYRVAVPPATGTLDVRLDWVNMEARYPFSDLDVILTPPIGAVVTTCSTTRAPERCTVTNPAAGTWTVKVVGLTVPTFGLPGDAETYTLRLAAGGTVLPLER